ncbi:MAG: tetratricopeptide repeat protein [Bacteroidetes bacterium]|nr:tetratricopeptide repeat protein [Bacteroidota bacterium]
MSVKANKNKVSIKHKPKQEKPLKGEKIVSGNIPKWAPIAVLVFTALLYAKALTNGFATWDDDCYILQNPYIRDFSLNGIKSIFTTFYNANYHPLTTLIYLFEYNYFGLNPFPFHLLSVLLHLLNTWLVFKFVEQLSGKKITSLVVSLLFAIHPMHVESVAWVSEQKDVLYSLFYLLSLLLYLRYLKLCFSANNTIIPDVNKSKRTKYYIGTLLFFTFSLLSKSTAITLPVLLIALDIYKGRKINAKSLIEKIPFIILSVFFGILAILSQQSVINDFFFSFSYIQKVFLFTYTIAFYIVKLIAPFNLSAMHYYPDIHGGIFPWQYYASLPLILFIALLLIRRISKVFKKSGIKKEIIFGILFFLITISVTLQIVNVGFALTAERYTYIPYIGLFYIAGQWISGILEKHKKIKYSKVRNTVIAVFSVFAIMFTCQTWYRIGVWKDGEILFTDVIKNNPDMYHCYWIRGNIKYGKADYQGALEDYNSALKYNPKHFCIRNRGYVRNKLGDFKGAIEDMNFAINSDSTIAETYNIRGMAYYGLGNIKSAILDYSKAILLNPKYAEAYNYRGAAYYVSGDIKSALPDYNKAIQLYPEYAEAYNNRGAAYCGLDNTKLALADFDKTILFSPKYAVAYDNRGVLKTKTGDINGAMKDINMAISLAPDNPKTFCNRAYIKIIQKDLKGAIEDFNYSLKLKPDDGKIYYDRGLAHYNLNETTEACKDWQKALELGNEDAIHMLHQYCK